MSDEESELEFYSFVLVNEDQSVADTDNSVLKDIASPSNKNDDQFFEKLSKAFYSSSTRNANRLPLKQFKPLRESPLVNPLSPHHLIRKTSHLENEITQPHTPKPRQSEELNETKLNNSLKNYQIKKIPKVITQAEMSHLQLLQDNIAMPKRTLLKPKEPFFNQFGQKHNAAESLHSQDINSNTKNMNFIQSASTLVDPCQRIFNINSMKKSEEPSNSFKNFNSLRKNDEQVHARELSGVKKTDESLFTRDFHLMKKEDQSSCYVTRTEESLSPNDPFRIKRREELEPYSENKNQERKGFVIQKPSQRLMQLQIRLNRQEDPMETIPNQKAFTSKRTIIPFEQTPQDFVKVDGVIDAIRSKQQPYLRIVDHEKKRIIGEEPFPPSSKKRELTEGDVTEPLSCLSAQSKGLLKKMNSQKLREQANNDFQREQQLFDLDINRNDTLNPSLQSSAMLKDHSQLTLLNRDKQQYDNENHKDNLQNSAVSREIKLTNSSLFREGGPYNKNKQRQIIQSGSVNRDRELQNDIQTRLNFTREQTQYQEPQTPLLTQESPHHLLVPSLNTPNGFSDKQKKKSSISNKLKTSASGTGISASGKGTSSIGTSTNGLGISSSGTFSSQKKIMIRPKDNNGAMKPSESPLIGPQRRMLFSPSIAIKSIKERQIEENTEQPHHEDERMLQSQCNEQKRNSFITQAFKQQLTPHLQSKYISQAGLVRMPISTTNSQKIIDNIPNNHSPKIPSDSHLFNPLVSQRNGIGLKKQNADNICVSEDILRKFNKNIHSKLHIS